MEGLERYVTGGNMGGFKQVRTRLDLSPEEISVGCVEGGEGWP